MTRDAVLAAYAGTTAGLTWEPVGGGFSGAAVWRGTDRAVRPTLALKAWPAGFSAARLRAVHARIGQLTHLPFIPRIHRTTDLDTVVEAGGRAWDVIDWMPGAPERGTPSAARVAAAAAALAAVHAAWRPLVPPLAPCPGVARRLRALADWDAVRPDRTLVGLPDPLGRVVRRAAEVLPARLPAARAALSVWSGRPVAIQPCLGDVWPEHVLFTGDVVSGLIDFGAVKGDHVGVDLARLFGAFSGSGVLSAGLTAYRAAGGVLAEPDEFVRLLAAAGVVCGAVVWLLRLRAAGGAVADPAAVAARLGQLLDVLSGGGE